MKKIFLIFVLLTTVLLIPGCSDKQLTTEQKVKDFEFLYQTLKENYPYFGVGKRKTGIDWLSKKDEYIQQIKDTKTDSAYYFTLDRILTDIGNGHTDVRTFNGWWDMSYDVYSMVAQKEGEERYKKWVEVLKDSKARPHYWGKILEKEHSDQQDKQETTTEEAKPYLTDSIIPDKGIAIMHIKSLPSENIEKDKPMIDKFLTDIKDYKFLIIDIQDNGGGSEYYWRDNIVQRLLQDSLSYVSNFIIKDGQLNRHFYPDYFEGASVISKTESMPALPDELLDGTFYLKPEATTLYPVDPIPFRGKIYLLVNRVVYSSAEGLAYFCKTTGWATVAGQRTGGDGVGSDPIPFVLPESGIIVRIPSLSGLNQDGSLNSETRTVPDIDIEAKTSEERLNKLINYLTDAK